MYPSGDGIKGKRFVPMLGLGFVIFTVLGLLATYLVASAMTAWIKRHQPPAKTTHQRVQR